MCGAAHASQWEIAECVRKVVVVGVFLMPLFEPGTMLQLLLGSVFSMMFLVMQVQAAEGQSACCLAVFASCHVLLPCG